MHAVEVGEELSLFQVVAKLVFNAANPDSMALLSGLFLFRLVSFGFVWLFCLVCFVLFFRRFLLVAVQL
jgi:hypothetical protein